MKSRRLTTLAAAALLLLAAGGCAFFRDLFSDGERGGAPGDSAPRRERAKRDGDGSARRDPVADMFRLEGMRDKPVRHQGIPLTESERAIFDAAEDGSDRDRALIDDMHRRMNSDRKSRRNWVFSFKPE